MVRNYVRKTTKGTAYTKLDLESAVAEVRDGSKTFKTAAVEYNIPKITLYKHVKGLRGHKSTTGGRAQTIPQHLEQSLAIGLKTMEKWGFGLSRREVQQVVGDYVKQTGLKTPFKDGVPGEDWFLDFKKRNKLSIKKPQSVEYARKKTTDPFVIYEYFELLKNTMESLEIVDSPERIWNLDETSFSMDPSKTKVVGARGTSSSRTVSGPGRDNTTVLSACSAAGEKLPPLIVFKGENVWDQWFAPPDRGYPDTKYAASPNGWMESDIFANFFENTFILQLKEIRPVLLLYDGHSTHVGTRVIQIAIRENITILKLPPHTSHLLQPLDLAVFKSLKTTWDAKLVTWQRKHIGQKLPKKDFSILLGETWAEISPEILSHGFKKAGVYPFDANVVNPNNFDPSALRRWNSRHVTPQESEEPESSPVGATLPNFEQVLLVTIKQTKATPKLKRTRVGAGAEVISTTTALARMAELPVKKPRITKPNIIKKRAVPKQGTKKNTASPSMASTSVATSNHSTKQVSSQSSPAAIANKHSIDLTEGKWVLVKYRTKRDTLLYYIGLIVSKNHSVGVGEANWNVKFVKSKDGHFIFPKVEDADTIDEEDVVKVLPVPTTDRRGENFSFPVNLDDFKIR